MVLQVTIVGGGIMGCATAYYLTKLGSERVQVTLIERHRIAGHASGKAGGFLALDWCDGGPVEALARKSFQLHEELATELGTNIDYRKLDTLSMAVEKGRALQQKGIPAWVDGTVTRKGNMGTPKTTAQVHPELLTQALFRAAEKNGAKLIQGQVVQVHVEASKVKSVQVKGRAQPIPADIVVIAMGPWSGLAQDWFPKATIGRVTGSRAHSVVLDTSQHDITPHALFLDIGSESPEIYPRPDGTIYMAGTTDGASLPEDPADVSPDPEAVQKLVRMAGIVSGALERSPLVKGQACYLPCVGSGKPLIGQLKPYQGAFIATGHTCWGILNGPATGLVLAELILTGKSNSVNIKHLMP
ncbi:hypothetical protein TCAL_08189 [Tigriopus californicus]|uniref:FAD dependent oxidoreductase domain-containing protein n=2 Tax=Tigriopus californicus TaxID=6832 RepID=A0A553NC08_TIGCA|nr:hypothetical protein TCAL_08189 [Tigriopus californicus]